MASTALITPALAGDLTVTAPRTTPVTTSNADGNGPGNVTVTSAGGIAVTSGATVTVDSSNSLTNQGNIANSGESNATAVKVAPGAAGATGAITNSGTISVPGPASASTLFNTSVFNNGILLNGAGTFHGSITNNTGAVLSAGGNASVALSVQSALDGSILNNGKISAGGNTSWAIQTAAPVSGDITNAGTIEAFGQGSIGIYAGAGAGMVTNTGSISTGANPTTDSSGAAVSTAPGGHALWVAGNVKGILLQGDGVTKDQATAGVAGNGLADSNLSTIGGVEALYVGPGGASGSRDFTVGANAEGSSILIRGNVTTTAPSSTTISRAMNVTGQTIGLTDYHTTLLGNIRIDGGNVTATGTDSAVNAIRIGELTKVPGLINTGGILAQSSDSSENASTGASGFGGGDATAITIDARGSLTALNNSGIINAESHGSTQSAYAVVDNSGTLTSVVNTGSVTASVKGSGSVVAFDLSHATSAISFTNSGAIIGSIALGSGNNSFTSTAGGLQGNVTFGAGNDTVALTNTLVNGTIDLGDGNNSLTVNGGSISGGILSGAGTTSLSLTGTTVTIPVTSQLHVTNARFSGNSVLNFTVDASGGTAGLLKGDGTVVLDPGTTINTTITGQVSKQVTVDLIEAGALTMNRDLSQIQPSQTIMYAKQIAFATLNPNILQLQITRNTASQLHLTSPLGAVYEGVVPGLATDSELSQAMGGITARSDFEGALTQLTPDSAAATRLASLESENLAQSVIRRRLDGILRDRNDYMGSERSSYWVQNYETYGTQGAQTSTQGALPGYRLISGGLAGGLDGELAPGVQLGFGVDETLNYIQEHDAAKRNVAVTTSGFDLYTRYAGDAIFVQAIGDYGYTTYSSSRKIAISGIDRNPKGSWTGNRAGGAMDVGTNFGDGATTLTPYFRGAYTRIFEQAYSETGGGDGADITYLHHITTSLRAGGGAQIRYQSTFDDFSRLELSAHADYAHEFRDGAVPVQALFTGGTVFTLAGAKPASAVISGGFGGALKRRYSSLSLDYDIEHAGGFLGHTLTLTWRQRL